MRAVKRRIRYPGCAFIPVFNVVLVDHCPLVPVKVHACPPVNIHPLPI